MDEHSSSDRGRATGLNRRALLRTSGAAVLAGVAAVAVADGVTAGVAQAAAGGPLVLGAANDAGAAQTSLAAAVAAGPTLALTSTTGLAPLRIVEQPVPATAPALASGDLANYAGNLYYAAGGTGGPFIGFVYTEVTANQVATIKPQRILDTRTAAGRAQITNAAGNLDSSGRLLAGHTIVIDLSTLVVAPAAVYCNLTAVSPLTGGFLTLFPGGTRPATSSLNFGANAVVANFGVTGATSTATADTVSIFSAATTHVLLDVTAFAVGNPGQVNPAILAASVSTAQQQLAARTKAGALPHWYQAR